MRDVVLKSEQRFRKLDYTARIVLIILKYLNIICHVNPKFADCASAKEVTASVVVSMGFVALAYGRQSHETRKQGF